MHLAVRNSKDIFAGILFLITGAGVILIARNYDLGTPQRMGPGYFPVILGALLCVLALLIIARAFTGEQQPPASLTLEHLRIAFLILASMLVFGLLIREAGLLASVLVLVLLGTLAMRGYGWRAAIVTAVILAAGSSIIFVELLGLPVPIIGPLFIF